MFKPKVSIQPRPAGESDENDSSDDDGFDMPGFRNRKIIQQQTSNPTSSYIPPTTNGGAQVDDEEDWGAATSDGDNVGDSQPHVHFSHTPIEEIRLACIRGDLEKLKTTLEKYQVNVNSIFSDNYTPLMTAAAHGHPSLIEYLLAEKAEVNFVNRLSNKTTALIAAVACTERRTEDIVLNCVKLLVEAQANVNLQDGNGITALGIAVKRYNVRMKVAEYLLENGADPNLIDCVGRTPLFYAAEFGAGRVCRILIEKGADASIVDDSGWSAAEVANEKGFFRLAELIHIIHDTKWRPGLNPKLMNKIDEEAASKKKLTGAADGVTIREDSQIELLLSSLEARKYMENFRKHRITYVQFLHMEEEQLKEIGIEEMGIRNKILDSIREVHNTEWAKSSLKMVPVNKRITAAEAVCMVNSIKLHIQYMSATVRSMKNRIKKDPSSLQYGKERHKIQDLITMCKDVNEHSETFDVEVLDLLQFLEKIESNAEFKLGDEVPPQNLQDLISQITHKKRNPKKTVTSSENGISTWKVFGYTVGAIVILSFCSSKVRRFLI